MKVLFVTMWPLASNTSASLRNQALIRGLAELGCQVDVVTIVGQEENPFHDRVQLTHENESASAPAGSVRLHTLSARTAYQAMVGERPGLLGSLRRRLLPLARFLYHALQLFDFTQAIARRVRLEDLPRRSYDLVISSSDPKSSHLAVRRWLQLGLQCGRWLQYWGDPLALDITSKHRLPAPYVRHVERSLIRLAARVVYVSPFTLEAQRQLYPLQAAIMSWLPIPYLAAKRYPLRPQPLAGRLRIGYFGDYKSHVRNLLPLLEACRSRPDLLELVVAGNTDLQPANCDNITVYPRIPQQEVERLEAACDLLVCLLNRRGTQIPGKLYHYAATNKPVLVILDGERAEDMETFLLSFHRYLTVANDVPAIVQVFEQLRAGLPVCEPVASCSAAAIAEQFLQLANESY